MLAAGLIASRFIHYAAAMALFGASLFPLYAGRETSLGDRLSSWTTRLSFVAAIVALAGGLGWFAFTTASMAGSLASAVDPAVIGQVVAATDFGPLWLARMGLVLAIAVVAASRRTSTFPTRFMAVISGLMLISLAGTGHARETQGWAGPVHIAVDAAHLAAAGVWLGGLAPLGWVLAQCARTGAAMDAERVLLRFSGVGYLAVAALVATGLVNAWLLVKSPGALIATTYGRLLSAKVAIFLVMAGLAAVNRFRLTPRLGGPATPSTARTLNRLRLHVAAEQGLGLLVLAIVSALGTLDPAA